MLRLKKIREDNKFTQVELGKLVNMDQRTLSGYETGYREMPVRKAKEIAKMLKVDWWILYEEMEEEI